MEKKIVIEYGLNVLIDLVAESFHDVYICQIIVLYNLNTYNFICPLYLNKAEKTSKTHAHFSSTYTTTGITQKRLTAEQSDTNL